MSIRVLQVLSQDLVGGTELLVGLVAPRLAEAGVDSRVATLDAPGPVAERLAAQGIPVASLGGGRLGRARAAVRLARLLRREPVDVVEAYGFKASQLIRYPMRLQGTRAPLIHGVMGAHITEVLDFHERKGRFALWLEARTSALIHTYEVISRDAIELLAASGIPREKLTYLPNGIDMALWPMRDRPPEGGRPLVICNARFTGRKRQIDLVEAAALLRERGVDCRMLLAGTGPELEAVDARRRELGLEDRVELPGVLAPARLRELMSEASVFCLPSLWEGQAGAILEAMASGVPVITTDAPGNRELVEHGKNGLLVAPMEPAQVAAAITRVLDDPGSAGAMAADARRRVEEDYSLELMVERRLALYERVARTATG